MKMATTPKWYCRNKSQPIHKFTELLKLNQDLRRITKRLVIDVKVDIFSEHDTLLDDCEEILNTYWSLKDTTKNTEYQSLVKKSKRNPYNALLLHKYNSIIELNDRRFCQLICTLKKTLTFLLRKSLQSEIWLNWALQITELYNKYHKKCNANVSAVEKSALDDDPLIARCDESTNANICRNMYPALLLPSKSIDFSYVLQTIFYMLSHSEHAFLQLITQQRLEQNSLDLLFSIFNWNEHEDAWRDKNESNCSSMEILRILTLNLNTDGGSGGDFLQFYEDPVRAYSALSLTPVVNPNYLNVDTASGLRSKHIQLFLQNERSFVAQLIDKAFGICPSIFGYANSEELHEFVLHGVRLMWSHVGVIIDHIVLWWIDTPISCYSLTYVESITNWLYNQNVNDIPEPVYSTLMGLADTLTNFVSTNLWDRLFRLTLISDSCNECIVEYFLKHTKPSSPTNKFGTATGTIWISIFNKLINFSNSYFQNNDVNNSSLFPVAEQIPILHRIDHTIHCFRLWVQEQSKKLCNEWKMDRFFQIHEHDLKLCISGFTKLQLPKLTADLSDILMLVCVALRTKLICEVNVNLDKLKKTTEECVHILSNVCRLLSLANFTLCFPSANYWQRTSSYPSDEKSDYVAFVLDHIYLPCIKATKDICILKLILKLICEAWLDFIYQRQIHFSINGAVRLLHDFDQVREWILNCPLLVDQEDHLNRLSNHEVLRMCKGVGKILLRKPEDIISITHSPAFERKIQDANTASVAADSGTQLPSEMFVSNQKHWLRLRASKSTIKFLPFCCNDPNN